MIPYWLLSGFRLTRLNKAREIIISYFRNELFWANIRKSEIWESEKQKLLGIAIDRNLRFDEHIFSQCKKASRRLTVLVRICNFMTIGH